MTPLPWSGDMCTMHGRRLVGEMPDRADDAAMESWRSCCNLPATVSCHVIFISSRQVTNSRLFSSGAKALGVIVRDAVKGDKGDVIPSHQIRS